MSRTREDIIADIDYCTKWAEYYTKRAEDFKQELKEFDAEEKGE